MDKYGLVGYPLKHSYSPGYFSNFFKTNGIDATYQLFPLKDIKKLPELINSEPGLKGLNVTIPYKSSVIPFLDYISEEAQKIGAVNTIKIHNSELLGYNTDCYGFEKAYQAVLQKNIKQAIILGTGGSSKTVAYVLEKYSVPYYKVSRNTTLKEDRIISYKETQKDLIEHSTLIINTTPLGMYPDTNKKPPICYSGISHNHFLIDLIYNPNKTLFLKEGEKHGASVFNGLDMLRKQAEEAWKIWISKKQ